MRGNDTPIVPRCLKLSVLINYDDAQSLAIKQQSVINFETKFFYCESYHPCAIAYFQVFRHFERHLFFTRFKCQ